MSTDSDHLDEGRRIAALLSAYGHPAQRASILEILSMQGVSDRDRVGMLAYAFRELLETGKAPPALRSRMAAWLHR